MTALTFHREWGKTLDFYFRFPCDRPGIHGVERTLNQLEAARGIGVQKAGSTAERGPIVHFDFLIWILCSSC